jgi:hypothetical protein
LFRRLIKNPNEQAARSTALSEKLVYMTHYLMSLV